MSITQARTLIVKHHKYAWILTLSAVFVISGVYFRDTVTHAAMFYFQQSSWSGGDSLLTARHLYNQNSNWNTYDSASSTLSAGETLSLTTTSYTVTDTSDTADVAVAPSGGPAVSGGRFTIGADDSNVAITGTGDAASVQLNVDSGTGGQGAVSVTTGACSGTGVTGTAPNCTIAGGTYNYTTFLVDTDATLTVTGSTGLVVKATGIVTINGTISANGGAGQNGNNATSGADYAGGGGGGGGLIKIISNEQITIASTGIISANGGAGGSVVAGGIVGTVPGGTAGAGGSAGGDGLVSGWGGQDGFGIGGGDTGWYCGDGEYIAGSGGGHGGTGRFGAGSLSPCPGPLEGIAYDDATMGGSGGGGGGNSGQTYATAGGGGSGGRIDIISKTTVVNGGIIRANGGAGGAVGRGPGGGGAGGRINLSDSDGVVTGTATVTLGTGGSGGSAGVVAQLTPIYAPTGTFTSAPINLGASADFTGKTLDWSETLLTDTDIQIQMRSASTQGELSFAVWYGPTGTGDWYTASGSTINTVHNGAQWVQYKAVLTSPSPYSATPLLNSVTVNYSQYSQLGSLVSSFYNSESDANIMGGLVWTEDATLPSGSTATFYLRTSATSDFGASSWSTGITSGTTGCTKVDTTVTCAPEAVDSALRDGINDKWFQYKLTLTSLGGNTPTIDEVKVVYVVNGPPTFDTTYSATGVITSQNTTVGDADYGKVNISYRVGDIDTGSFTPSFKYSVNGGSSWSDISSGDLSADATSLKTYTGGATTTFSVVWNATSTLSANPVNVANAKVRVTAYDGDVANHTGIADSAEFTLDTTYPAIASGNFVVDSSVIVVNGVGEAGTPGDNRAGIKLYATDYSTIQYRLCNDSAFPSTDTQGNSCEWSTLATSPISLATSSTQWITTGYPNAETVYMQVRDAYGNVTSGTASAPAMPANFDYKDVSNTAIDVYREFLSWSLFSATDSSTFTGNSSGRYKLYHATASDGSPAPASSSYSAVTSIADPTINYATHNITSATTSVHYYKVTAINDLGSISDFTTVLSDIPNGSGGAVSLPPEITDTPTADTIRNTSAHITFTTDSLATSTIEYGTTDSYGSFAYQTSFVENHSVYLNSLSADTLYYFRAKATNAEGLDSDWATGATFRTAQGTVISGVTPMNITDKTATIFWNTNASSTSKVYYSTDRSGSTLVNPVTVTGASATTAGTNGKFQHQVGVPSSGAFTAGNTYYYKVESTDADNNTTTDDNNGQFYSFTTTLDTTAPTISNISAAVVGPTSAVIVWTTDEPATSQVRWSGTTGNHSKRTTTDMTFAGIPSYSVYHVATLSSQTQNVGEGGGTNVLVAETPYYYTVVSADAAGNETESTEETFTTTRTGEDVIVTVSRSLPAGEGDGGPVADTTSPVITNMKVSDITPFTATVTFDTSEASVGKLGYSKDTSYGDHAADDFSWGTKHTIKLRGLTLGTQYHIKAVVVDKAGNTGYSEEQTFKTSFLSENVKELAKIENIEQFQKEIEDTIESILPSLVPPFVSKPSITDITESGATISFRTNIKAFPLIGFVEDGTYNASKENPYTSEVSDTTEKATNHTLALLNLKPNTKYHVQARAFSLPQVVGKSEDLTFTTQASKIQSSIVETKRDSFTVVWITDEPTTSIVEYKDLSSGITQRKADDRKTTSHSVKIENLPSGTSFDVNVSGLNEGGNLIEAGSTLHVTTSRDIVPPTISNFKVSNAMVPGRTDRIQTIISWRTDEPADSVVYFEEGVGTAGAEEKELANKSEVLDAYVLDHNIIISSLKPGAIYRIKVTSVDESGNLGVFGPRTIITPKQTESITDIIFKNFEDSFKFLRDM